MAADLDVPPVYDLFVKDAKYMSDKYRAWIESFKETLDGYLSSFGMFIPRITTVQRDLITTPVEGQMIYNTTLLAPQIYQGGVWKTFTTT